MTEHPFEIAMAHWPEDRDTLAAVRELVFVREQGVPLDLEWDGRDDSAIHVLARAADGQAVGTARLLPTGKIGRMAVLAAWRRRGVGRAMLAFLLEAATTRGFQRVFLNAQTSARRFYAQEGFTDQGGVFEEAGIPHIRMERRLNRSG